MSRTHSSTLLLPAVLVAATLTTGLTAGVFFDWTHTVMPGLATTDDRFFVSAFQVLDRAILDPPFLLLFVGAPALMAVAVVLTGRSADRAARPWAAAGLVLYLLAAFIVTLAVHEPLNTTLRNAGDPDAVADPAALRTAFDESSWVAWHLVRTIATTAALACLAWALVRCRPVTRGENP